MKSSESLETTKGLLGHLADTMLALEKKLIDAQEANAQAALVRQSNNIFRYEWDKKMFEYKLGIKSEEKNVETTHD